MALIALNFFIVFSKNIKLRVYYNLPLIVIFFASEHKIVSAVIAFSAICVYWSINPLWSINVHGVTTNKLDRLNRPSIILM